MGRGLRNSSRLDPHLRIHHHRHNHLLLVRSIDLHRKHRMFTLDRGLNLLVVRTWSAFLRSLQIAVLQLLRIVQMKHILLERSFHKFEGVPQVIRQ